MQPLKVRVNLEAHAGSCLIDSIPLQPRKMWSRLAFISTVIVWLYGPWQYRKSTRISGMNLRSAVRSL